MFKRKRISSSGTESPAMKIRKLFSGIVLKLVFCVIISVLIYLVFNYFIFNFINFLLVNIAETSEITRENTYFIGIEIFAIIIGLYIVLRDRLRKR